ncbi:MAG: hypothetical protein ACNA8W_23435 [Bradymonadaceae bacterium]
MEIQRTWAPASRYPFELVMRFLIAALLGSVVAVYAGGVCAETPGDGSRHTIEFGVGMEYLGSRDDIGSPMRYEGYAYPLRLAYSRANARGFHGVEASFSHFGFNSGHLKAAMAEGENHQAEPTMARLSYGYWRHLHRGGRLDLFAGAALNTLVFFRSYQYDVNQIGSVETWDGLGSLDVSARLGLKLTDRQRLHGRVSLPLAGYVLRPSYSVRGDERLQLIREQWRVITDGQWASWGRMQRIEAGLGYGVDITQSFGLGAAYHFAFFRVTHPMVSRGLTNRWSVSGSWSF